MFKPKYRITDKILGDIAEIERFTAWLNSINIPEEILTYIQKQCIIALTHFSTEIEGNRLSMEQVSEVVEKKKTYSLIRDEKEVLNYFALFEKISSLSKKFKGNINTELILLCHTYIQKGIVNKNLLGRFREVQNAIYEAGTKRLVYLPPEPKDVKTLISDLCDWVNSAAIHPIILAAIFHNQFVTIHPFIDGNGRLARFLSIYLLASKKYEWRKVVPVDRYYAENRGLYYSMIQQNYSHNYYFGRAKTNFSKWLEYYVHGVKLVLEGTIHQIELYRTEKILMNNRQTKILHILKEKEFITAGGYAKRFNISTRMATRDLNQLVLWKRLKVIGKARATKYFL